MHTINVFYILIQCHFIFILNSYFPCDSQKSYLSLDEIAELTNLTEDISDLLKKYKADYDVPIILGDLNFDSRRFTSHVQTICQFFEDNSLFSVWDMFPVDFTYSCSQSTSIIDHCILPNNMAQIISDCGVLHDSENMSGHSPIYLKVDLLKSRNPVDKVERKPRLNWTFSSEEQRKYYANCLDEKISHLNHSTSTFCKNIFCNDENHRADIDILTENLVNAMVESAWVNLEQTKGTTGDQTSRAHTIPGWNDNVKPFQDEAKFWFSVWCAAGKPIHSNTPGVEHELFNIMKTSKNQYHYAVRRLQNRLKFIENDKLFSKMGSSNMFSDIGNRTDTTEND